MYDTIVYIGRFQPLHNAHLETIKYALTQARQVLVLVGSSHLPRTYKNPWLYSERRSMIVAALGDNSSRVFIEPLVDTAYDDMQWATQVQEVVMEYCVNNKNIAVIGCNKDESSFYLKMFPQWAMVEMPLLEPLSATDIRSVYFKSSYNPNFLKGVVPQSTIDFLADFKNTDSFNQVLAERTFIEKYRSQYASLPYPPIFVTVDAAVFQSGHVLMVKRKSEPGRGLWALPGGFVNADGDRSIQDAMIRELREETRLKVPTPVLMGSIKSSRVFDARDRSARGRTITHAFKIVLNDGELPPVKGSDDAEKAQWIPLSDVDRSSCFEDHYDIIQYFTNSVV